MKPSHLFALPALVLLCIALASALPSRHLRTSAERRRAQVESDYQVVEGAGYGGRHDNGTANVSAEEVPPGYGGYHAEEESGYGGVHGDESATPESVPAGYGGVHGNATTEGESGYGGIHGSEEATPEGARAGYGGVHGNATAEGESGYGGIHGGNAGNLTDAELEAIVDRVESGAGYGGAHGDIKEEVERIIEEREAAALANGDGSA